MTAPAHALGDGIVGRRRELEVFRARLGAVRAGGGSLVLCVGEPGIGKTRLAQELAGAALANGIAVAWGRCVETEGVPALWPWRQVLRSLGESEAPLSGDFESPEDRFRIFEEVTATVTGAAGPSGLVVILDDIHWADELSLLVLRHLADAVAGTPLLVFAASRDVEPTRAPPEIVPDLLRTPTVERLDLRGFDLAEVREQLSRMTDDAGSYAPTVLDVTAGNPLFVRELARAIADGTWRADRPPRTVLEVVSARVGRVSPECRQLVQAAAILGRDFPLALVAATLGRPVGDCLAPLDEAVSAGMLEALGERDSRFTHALTRDAVVASLATADRLELHRAAADAIERFYEADLSDHVADLARHWAALAPYGEGATARGWTLRAADDAVRRLAYEEAVRLYRSALAFDAPAPTDGERGRILVALARAAYFAGDVNSCVDAATAATDAARMIGDPSLAGEAALVIEAGTVAGANAIAKELCERALDDLGETGHEALRARLLAQRSHLAFYDGDEEATERSSTAALALAHRSGDDRALVDALHARKEASARPQGREERLRVAREMLVLAQRTNSPRTAMWGQLWRTEALIESGALHEAAGALSPLGVAVARVGGPVSAWHLDRISACVAQARGRYGEASELARRAFERMHAVEPGPARGAFFALQCILARHIGITDDAALFVEQDFDPLPLFRSFGRLNRAVLLLDAGRPDNAAASYRRAGPLGDWSLPVFHVLGGHVSGLLAAIGLGEHDDVVALLDRLEPFRGEHVAGDGVYYMGPVELALGRGRAALGQLDVAIEDLTAAMAQAEHAGAPGFAAETRYHLATALLARDRSDDRARATTAARDADRLARDLGMAAYVERTSALVARLVDDRTAGLSGRELEVADLVAEGLTNRQIADRLFISQRTAQNHVQHILTKLGFTTRAQIAAWRASIGE